MKLHNLTDKHVMLHDRTTVEPFGDVEVDDEAYYKTHFKHYFHLRNNRWLVEKSLYDAAQAGDVKAIAALEGFRGI